MSIGRSQARALADGFLDNVGSDDKQGIQPRETYTELILLAGELVEKAQKNLNTSHSISSGALSESLHVEEPQLSGTALKVDVYMNFYGKFVNSGVAGTKSGAGVYKFKTPYPSKGMVEAIQKWIKRAHLSTVSIKRKPVSGLERKRQSVSALNLGRSVAFSVATSIKQKGIKPTGFLDKAITDTKSVAASRFANALEIDVINSLT